MHAIDILNAGSSLDITGDHGSGRTHLLKRIEGYFGSREWEVLSVSGSAAFRKAPMSALGWLGISAQSAPGALVEVQKRLGSGRSIITVDDGDDVDEASWGVLSRVRSEANIPIVSVRTYDTSSQRVLASTGSMRTYRMELSPLRSDELEMALVQHTGHVIEQATMSRIFAKTGGNIGIALALYESAQREGLIRVDDGVAILAGGLWAPGMSSTAESILRPLSVEQRAGLETMAMLGPAPLHTVLRLMPRGILESLGDAAMLDLYPVGDVHLVNVRHPLLVSYFRNQTHDIRQILVGRDIEECLGSGGGAPVGSLHTREHATLFSSLVHGYEQRRVLVSREAWVATPTKGTAAELLRALIRTGGTDEEVAEVLRESRDLKGSLEGTLAWESWRSVYLAYVRGDTGEATKQLRHRAQEQPELSPWLLSWEVTLRTVMDVVPEISDIPAPDGLTPEAHWEVQRTRAFVHLMSGRVGEALDILMQLRKTRTDPHLDALTVVGLVSDGEYVRASDIARVGIQEAVEDFDSGRMYAYAYMGALAGIALGRPGDAVEMISQVSQLAAPPDEVCYQLGVVVAATALSAKHEDVRMSMHGESSMTDVKGALPLMQHEWFIVEELKTEQRFEEAADVLTAMADRLWARGQRLSAAYAYIIAAEAHPQMSRLRALRERVALVGGRGMDMRRRTSVALIADDVAELQAVAAEHEAHGDIVLAMKVWGFVEHTARKIGDIRSAEVGREKVTGIGASLDDERYAPRLMAMPTTLTGREREVARLAASGLENKEIGKMLFITTRTVESHVGKVLKKSGVESRQELRRLFRS